MANLREESNIWIRDLLYVSGVGVRVQGPVLVCDCGVFVFTKQVDSDLLDLWGISEEYGKYLVHRYERETTFTILTLMKDAFRWEAPIKRRAGVALTAWEYQVGGSHKLLQFETRVENIYLAVERVYNPKGWDISPLDRM
jgi:hypothetical protein